MTGDDRIAPAFYATPGPWITWPEAVDQALCFGWIDGVRRRIDDASYMIRFKPRKRTSRWSMVNVRRVGELREARLIEDCAAGRPTGPLTRP